jgi:hypothetical protein
MLLSATIFMSTLGARRKIALEFAANEPIHAPLNQSIREKIA